MILEVPWSEQEAGECMVLALTVYSALARSSSSPSSSSSTLLAMWESRARSTPLTRPTTVELSTTILFGAISLRKKRPKELMAVSYTHLTLPTIA